jgi:hypothetical protein
MLLENSSAERLMGMKAIRELALVLCSISAMTVPVLAAKPALVTIGEGLSPKQPQAAVAADGTVHLVFGVGEAVFFCRSTDSGSTLTKPQEAFRVPNMSLGMRRGPRISVVGNQVIVTAIGGRRGKGQDGDVLAWRLTEVGTNWQGPVHVNDAPDSAREGLHAMAAGPDGSVWVTWLDLREKKTEIYLAKSTDAGATWRANVQVYRSPDGSVCECCHPSISVGDGVAHVMFRNSLAGNRDMYAAISKDDGKSFSQPKKLGQGTWNLNACPMDGGMLAPGPKDTIITVWRRNNEIFSAPISGGREQLLGHGEQPWVAGSPDGPVFVWTAGREGDLFVQSPANRLPEKLASGARDPVVCSAGGGPVIACWEAKTNGRPSVAVTRIEVSKSKTR